MKSHTVNPLSSSPFEGGEGGGGLFNLEKAMALVLHKELGYRVKKLMHKKVGGHACENQESK